MYSVSIAIVKCHQDQLRSLTQLKPALTTTDRKFNSKPSFQHLLTDIEVLKLWFIDTWVM